MKFSRTTRRGRPARHPHDEEGRLRPRGDGQLLRALKQQGARPGRLEQFFSSHLARRSRVTYAGGRPSGPAGGRREAPATLRCTDELAAVRWVAPHGAAPDRETKARNHWARRAGEIEAPASMSDVRAAERSTIAYPGQLAPIREPRLRAPVIALRGVHPVDERGRENIACGDRQPRAVRHGYDFSLEATTTSSPDPALEPHLRSVRQQRQQVDGARGLWSSAGRLARDGRRSGSGS